MTVIAQIEDFTVPALPFILLDLCILSFMPSILACHNRSLIRLFSILSLTMFLLVLSCSDLGPSDYSLEICDETGPSTRSNRERFGFFAPELYDDFPGHLDSLTRVFGATPGYVLWFLQIDDPFPSEKAGVLAGRGIRMVISMNLMSVSSSDVRNDTILSEICIGMWDSTLAAFARDAAVVGESMYLRFGYEMNGDWFSWGRKPALFVAAWQRAHSLFRAVGAYNVRWVFSPNILCKGWSVGHDLYAYYPGDSVVDIIGLDGYNYGDDFNAWYEWETFGRVFGETLQAVKDLGKPLWISETGCPSDQRRAEWLLEVFTFMDNNPCVEALLWFNAHKAEEPDFRIASDRGSLELLKSWLKN
jgi:mannan endo-1,4-beta-mannosidase